MFDTLEHFYFPKANARGSAIRLQETWQTILERRAYPEPVQRLLGEMTAGAAMLAGSITFNGPVLLEIAGDGPVRLAMVEVKPDLGIRAVVRLNESEADKIRPDSDLNSLGQRSRQGPLRADACAAGPLTQKPELPGDRRPRGVKDRG